MARTRNTSYPTKRAPRPMRTLVEIAQSEGYEPGAFSVRRLQEISAKLEAWRYHINKYGTPPEGYGQDLDKFLDLYARETYDLFKMESSLMEYFHPRMRSMDAKIEVAGEISLLELLTREPSSD